MLHTNTYYIPMLHANTCYMPIHITYQCYMPIHITYQCYMPIHVTYQCSCFLSNLLLPSPLQPFIIPVAFDPNSQYLTFLLLHMTTPMSTVCYDQLIYCFLQTKRQHQMLIPLCCTPHIVLTVIFLACVQAVYIVVLVV